MGVSGLLNGNSAWLWWMVRWEVTPWLLPAGLGGWWCLVFELGDPKGALDLEGTD